MAEKQRIPAAAPHRQPALDQRLRLHAFLDVLGLGVSSRRVRIDLARNIADESFKNIAARLGISPSRLAHWLDDERATLTTADHDKLTTIAGYLQVSEAWLGDASQLDQIPAPVVRAMDLGCAIGVLAAVQLYAAVTVQRCCPAFLRTLGYGQFADVLPIAAPYPARLNPSTQAIWSELVQLVPFIPPEAAALFTDHLDILASGDLDPNAVFDGPCALAIYAACGWAWDWAEKTLAHARPDTADHRLALRIQQRLGAASQRMDAAAYVAHLRAGRHQVESVSATTCPAPAESPDPAPTGTTRQRRPAGRKPR